MPAAVSSRTTSGATSAIGVGLARSSNVMTADFFPAASSESGLVPMGSRMHFSNASRDNSGASWPAIFMTSIAQAAGKSMRSSMSP